MKRICFSLIITVLILALFIPATVSASSSEANEYFDYSYLVELSKTQVLVNETFIAHVRSQGTCKQDLPTTISEAVISGRIIAKLPESKIETVLNPEFILQFDGIPGEKGQTFQKDADISLIFPEDSRPGTYEIVAQTTGAIFKVFGMWFDGLSYFPTDPIVVGPVECTGKTPVNIPSASANSVVMPSETSESTINSVTEVIPPHWSNLWIVWLAVAVGLMILGLIIWRFMFLRGRRSE
jgi:hypothetical protein